MDSDDKTRTGTKNEDDELLISHMIFADNSYILASSSTMLLEMAHSVTEKLTQRDLEWKTNEMQNARGEQCSRRIGPRVQRCRLRLPRVLDMLVMGSLLSNEADTISAVRHRMDKAMLAMKAEMYSYENPSIPEKRKHESYKQVVQSGLLYTSETWSCTKGLADTLHGFESRCMT